LSHGSMVAMNHLSRFHLRPICSCHGCLWWFNLIMHRGMTLICVLYPSHVSHQNVKLIHAQCFLPWAGCVWRFHGCHMLYAFYPCCMIKVSLMWNIKKFLRQWCKW
jgi:hypothetical protein